jgi:hypothetical protein
MLAMPNNICNNTQRRPKQSMFFYNPANPLASNLRSFRTPKEECNRSWPR